MKLHFVLMLLVSSFAFAQTPMLSVSGANFRPLALANTAPWAQDETSKAMAAEFDAALSYDLLASGLFQVLDRKSFLASSEEGVSAASITFENWANVGAEVLVKTELFTTGSQAKVTLHVFSVTTGKEDLKTSVTGASGSARPLAHRAANVLYRFFTRETGPFESKLAFVQKRNGQKDIFVGDWDGLNARALTTGGINLMPTFAPGANTVAFTSFRNGKPEIFAQRVGGAVAAIVRDGRMATGVTYSPDGQRIAYALAEGDGAQIWVAKANGSQARAITSTPFFINSSPSFSPDGTQIAFVSNRAGSPQIYSMNVDGSNVRRLTFQGNYNQTPIWSPRGDLIAFTARDERNAFDLFAIEVASGKIIRLTQDQGNNEEPNFSPNGRHIVFMSNRNGSRDLFIMTSEGKNQMALPLEKGMYSTPEWSH